MIQNRLTLARLGLIVLLSAMVGTVQAQIEMPQPPSVLEEPRTAGEFFRLGVFKFQGGDYAAAEKAFTEAIDREPKYTAAWVNRGLARYQNGQPAKAAADFEAAIDLEPYRADLYLNLGLARQAMDDLDGATQALGEALALDPRLAAARVRRASIRAGEGRLQEALDDYNAALGENERFVGAYLGRAILFKRMREFAAAEADLNAAILIDSESAPAFMLRGSLYMDMTRTEEALADFDAALARQPRLVEALLQRGALYAALGQASAAMDDFERASEIAPDSGVGQFLFAAVLYGLGNHAQSQRLFERALEGPLPEEFIFLGSCWVDACRRQLSGTAHEATRVREALESGIELANWERALGEYLIGKRSYAKAVEAAQAAEFPSEALCVTHFMGAQLALGEGRLDESVERLRATLRTATLNFLQYGAAQLQLREMLLGAQFKPVPISLRRDLGLEKDTGFVVASLRPDGPLTRAGINTGDVVYRFEGFPADNARMNRLLLVTQPRQTLTVRFFRGNEPRDATIQLGPGRAP